MKIYIDEAGPFLIPQNKEWAVSCVGALVIKDSDNSSLLNDYAELKIKWGVTSSEIKGSQITETMAQSLILLISKYDVMFEIISIDMVTQSQNQIIAHKAKQAEKIIERVDERFNPNLVKQLYGLRDELQHLSCQLYTQAACSWLLFASILQKATLYYVQRSPEDLGQFHWNIDAKDKRITPYESMWKRLSLPFLESQSIQKPLKCLEGADYSYFNRFEREMSEPPSRLKEVLPDAKPYKYVDINEIYSRNITFEQSVDNLGLQLSDNLTTILRRAMNGNLQIHGWGNIGRLMVQSERGSQTIQLINLSDSPKPNYSNSKPPYYKVIPTIERTRKPMAYTPPAT